MRLALWSAFFVVINDKRIDIILKFVIFRSSVMRIRLIDNCISFVAVMVALSACNTVEKDFTPAAEEIASVEEHSYTFNILREGEEPTTKATIGESRVEWETSDKVGTFIASYKGYSNVNLENNEATITIYSTSAISAGEKVYAYFPYRSSQTSASEASIYIPSIQHGVSESAMPMVGIPYTMPEAADAKAGPSGAISFMNLGSIINFRIYSTNSAYVSEKVQYIRFTSDSGIVGSGTIDLTKIDEEDVSTLVASDYDGKIATVYQEANVGASRSESGEISMVIAPGTYSGTIVVVTDQASYTYEISSPKEFKRGYRKNLGVNLAVGQRGDVPTSSAQYIPYSETFLSDGKGLFTIENVSMGGYTGNVWTESSSYGMKATAYVSSTKYETESWLISPLINLDKAASPVLTFDHTMRYGENSQITLWIRKEGADWEQVTIPTYPSGSDWTYVSCEIDLSSYIGNIVQIGFKYTSTTSSAPTWEIKNFKVDGSYSTTPDVATPLVMSEISATSTTSSITFTWSEVANAVGYLVSFDGNTATQQTATSYTATGLNANTTYQISVTAVGDGTYYSNSTAKVSSMETKEASSSTGVTGSWLVNYEIPANDISLSSGAYYDAQVAEKYGSTKASIFYPSNTDQRIVTHTYAYNGDEYRTYTMLYDKNVHCALWAAFCMNGNKYPKNITRKDGWAYDPAIPEAWQPNLKSSYSGSYDRGHQVASADRLTTEDENNQTFYYSNMSPQASSLNQGNWGTFEGKIQTVGNALTGRDTLYVVTGAVFENTNSSTTDASSMTCPLPTKYYKVIMKCSFNTAGTMTAATGAGYYFEHTSSATCQFATIDQIETMTGFDFFANVPLDLQNAAEASSYSFF